jgi:aspartyl-tRNA(Asn)/glutamyl-tRNA(Gln) amidotransferase subunit A
VEASSSCGKYDGVRYGHRTAAAAKNWNDMYIKTRAESFGPLIKAYLFQGAYFQFENYIGFEQASRIRGRLVKDADGLWGRVEALAFPTCRRKADAVAASIDEIYHQSSLTLPANVMGLPAVQIPGFVLDGKKDLGLQIIGPRLGDARLLALAASLSHVAEGV